MREIKFRYWNSKNILGQEAIINHLNKYIARNDEHLMQFTGLLDKRGVEIYEGDIVTSKKYCVYAEKEKETNGEVYFTQGCFRINTRLLNDLCNLEVIGNIYENKELINKKEI